MTSTFGAPLGACVSRKAGQSAFESRMSRAMVPLNFVAMVPHLFVQTRGSSVHALDIRQLVTAIEQGVPRDIRAHDQCELPVRRRQPVGLRVLAFRLGMRQVE